MTEGSEENRWGGGVSGDLSLPGPWCPAHSEVSGWHCRSSAAGAAERRLWADRPPLCRRSLTETRQEGKRGMKGRKERKHKEHKQKDVRVHVRTHLQSICKTLNRGWPTAFVGRESSFRFSSHSWSCFFTLFMSDSYVVKHRKQIGWFTFTSLWCLCTEEIPRGAHGLQYSQSRRVHRPKVAMVSGWHSETSSVMNNRHTINGLNLQIMITDVPQHPYRVSSLPFSYCHYWLTWPKLCGHPYMTIPLCTKLHVEMGKGLFHVATNMEEVTEQQSKT